jgi:hypothetical protein
MQNWHFDDNDDIINPKTSLSINQHIFQCNIFFNTKLRVCWTSTPIKSWHDATLLACIKFSLSTKQNSVAHGGTSVPFLHLWSATVLNDDSHHVC